MSENGTGDRMIRVRLDDDAIYGRWKGVLDARKISQQRAVVAVLDWLSKQDPLTQAMIFGQVPNTDHRQLSRIVLERLEADAPKPMYDKLVDTVARRGKTK